MGEGLLPCHSSEPDIMGQDIVNPLRSATLILEYLDEETAAANIYIAVKNNLESGRLLSLDLGGKATTDEVVQEILRR
jgi:homoisocitrate dehydrogenase